MLPKTYLMVSPDKDDPLGRTISSSDLVRGLMEANPSFIIPTPDQFPGWYPGKAAGMTCIWLGMPSAPGSRKICGFHLGPVPEFTQIAPEGTILRRGWRAIFERVIKSGFVTKAKLERVFRVNLEYDGKAPWCQSCARKSMWVKAVAASGLCQVHENARLSVKQRREVRGEEKYLINKEGRNPHAV